MLNALFYPFYSFVKIKTSRDKHLSLNTKIFKTKQLHDKLLNEETREMAKKVYCKKKRTMNTSDAQDATTHSENTAKPLDKK